MGKKQKIKNRRRPIFPGSFPPSIVGSAKLNFCVRDGNRCSLRDIVTGYDNACLKQDYARSIELCKLKTEHAEY